MATRKQVSTEDRIAENTAAYNPSDDVTAIDALAQGLGATVERELERTEGGDIAIVPKSFDEDALRAISSFDDAVALATAVHGDLAMADQELGDGFALLDKDSKAKLVDVPLLLMEWAFYPGDFGDEFAAVRLVARNPDGSVGRYILNDGSRGVCDTLRKYTARTGKSGNLLVKKGLRRSDYLYCDMCRKATSECEVPEVHEKSPEKLWRPATTFYLDTSA